MSAVPTLCKIAIRLCHDEDHDEVAEWCYKAMHDMRVSLVRVVHEDHVTVRRGTRHLYGDFGDISYTYIRGDVLRLRNIMDFRPAYRPSPGWSIVTSMGGITFYIDNTHIAPYTPENK